MARLTFTPLAPGDGSRRRHAGSRGLRGALLIAVAVASAATLPAAAHTGGRYVTTDNVERTLESAQAYSPRGAGPTARTAAAAGVVYGGLTEATDRFPVVIELSKNRKQIVRASAGIRLQCSSSGSFTIPDFYEKVKVSKKGKFGVSFGPETFRNDDGTTDDVEGSLSGAFNAARTKVSGKWQSKLTHHDASGAVVDTCDSGVVSWSAKD